MPALPSAGVQEELRLQPTRKALVAGSAIALGIGLLSFFIFPLYFSAVGALLLPVFVALYFRCGAFPCGLAIGLLLFVANTLAGIWGALFMLLAYVPACITLCVMLRQKKPVYQVVYAGAAAAMVSLCAFIALTVALWPKGLTQTLVELVQSLFDRARELDPAAPFLISLEDLGITGDMLDSALRTAIPTQMALHAGLSSLLGVSLPLAMLRRKGWAERASELSPLHDWYVPRRVGRVVGLSYLAVLLLAMMGVESFLPLSMVMWQPMLVLYGAAGLAGLSATLRRRGVSRAARHGVVAAALLFAYLLQSVALLSSAPVLLGFWMEYRRMREHKILMGNNPLGPADPAVQEKAES